MKRFCNFFSEVDFLACIITFIASMAFGMEYGIIIGVGVSIGALLLRSLRPKLISQLKSDPLTKVEYILVSPSNGLYFPSVDHITNSIQKLTVKHKDIELIVINFSKWSACDFTGASTLVSVYKGMKKNGKSLVFLNCSKFWINAFNTVGLENPPVIHHENDYFK